MELLQQALKQRLTQPVKTRWTQAAALPERPLLTICFIRALSNESIGSLVDYFAPPNARLYQYMKHDFRW